MADKDRYCPKNCPHNCFDVAVFEYRCYEDALSAMLNIGYDLKIENGKQVRRPDCPHLKQVSK